MNFYRLWKNQVISRPVSKGLLWQNGKGTCQERLGERIITVPRYLWKYQNINIFPFPRCQEYCRLGTRFIIRAAAHQIQLSGRHRELSPPRCLFFGRWNLLFAFLVFWCDKIKYLKYCGNVATAGIKTNHWKWQGSFEEKYQFRKQCKFQIIHLPLEMNSLRIPICCQVYTTYRW